MELGMELGVWFNLLGLKILQCLHSLFFWILKSYCSILFKVKMFNLVWKSWSHSCCFYSFRSTTKILWGNLKDRSYLWIKAWEKFLICNKGRGANNIWWMKNISYNHIYIYMYVCITFIIYDKLKTRSLEKHRALWFYQSIISITNIRRSVS